MSINIYTIKCLTNIHVGSGDFNYGVVDNEVEKDCLTGNPVIHASGVKGALRDLAKKQFGGNEEEVKRIFGGVAENNTTNSGSYKFFDAYLLSRPLRVSGESYSYISVTTPEIINKFIENLGMFGFEKLPSKINIENLDFENNKFYSDVEGVHIEGDTDEDKAAKIPEEIKKTLDAILGKRYAIVKSFQDYKLPVIARNNVSGSKNLWYEEFVPHESVFYMMIMHDEPDGKNALDFSKPVQFGGNSSIGYGYTQISEFEVN